MKELVGKTDFGTVGEPEGKAGGWSIVRVDFEVERLSGKSGRPDEAGL